MSSTPQAPLFLAPAIFAGGTGAGRQKLIEEIRSRRLRVLVIDDTRVFRESMVYLLAEVFGAEATDARSGRDAIDLVRTGKDFNIIFLDLLMPDMNGLKTYEEIRQAGAACPVVLMSAHPDSEEWNEAESRDLELIEKPIAPEVLTSILREL